MANIIFRISFNLIVESIDHTGRTQSPQTTVHNIYENHKTCDVSNHQSMISNTETFMELNFKIS